MIALHTLFLREHNRLVKELHLLNPHWSPDTLYEEARKIMGAIHQVSSTVSAFTCTCEINDSTPDLLHLSFQILTWERYLPRVLGESAMSRLMPPYEGYDPEVDPSIANAFAAAAFRFAHVTVQPVVSRLGPGYTANSQHPPLPLHHSLFASWRVVQEGKLWCCYSVNHTWFTQLFVFLSFIFSCCINQVVSIQCCAACCCRLLSCRLRARWWWRSWRSGCFRHREGCLWTSGPLTSRGDGIMACLVPAS